MSFREYILYTYSTNLVFGSFANVFINCGMNSPGTPFKPHHFYTNHKQLGLFNVLKHFYTIIVERFNFSLFTRLSAERKITRL